MTAADSVASGSNSKAANKYIDIVDHSAGCSNIFVLSTIGETNIGMPQYSRYFSLAIVGLLMDLSVTTLQDRSMLN
jgi:hypothetical protein